MKQAWEWFKANMTLVLSVIGSIIGYFFLKQHFQKDLLAKLLNSETDSKIKVLEERKSNIEKDRLAEESKEKALRDGLGKGSNRSDDDIVDFYKKK